MRKPERILALAFLWLSSLTPVSATTAELGFDDRVRAQEAIERVYFQHRIETAVPFEEAVPDEALRRKVRTYLEQSDALERYQDASVALSDLDSYLSRGRLLLVSAHRDRSRREGGMLSVETRSYNPADSGSSETHPLVNKQKPR